MMLVRVFRALGKGYACGHKDIDRLLCIAVFFLLSEVGVRIININIYNMK